MLPYTSPNLLQQITASTISLMKQRSKQQTLRQGIHTASNPSYLLWQNKTSSRPNMAEKPFVIHNLMHVILSHFQTSRQFPAKVAAERCGHILFQHSFAVSFVCRHCHFCLMFTPTEKLDPFMLTHSLLFFNGSIMGDVDHLQVIPTTPLNASFLQI